MDTEWFAVDGQGHVAIFVTDEGGSVPEAECYAEQGLIYSVQRDLARSRPYDMDDRMEAADGKVFWTEMVREGGTPHANHTELDLDQYSAGTLPQVVVWLTREEGLDLLPQADPDFVRFANPGVVLAYCENLDKESLRALRTRGLLGRAWCNFEFEISRSGIYRYDFPSYEGQDPYRRTASPARPIASAGLPDEMREGVEKLRFAEADFARDEELQPRDYVECIAWDEG
jgi:hypothetical protein